MNHTLETIEKRSSTRGYTPEALSDTELEALLRAGLQAPTATNRQEIHFTVLKGDNPLLEEIESEKNKLRNLTAPDHNFYYEAHAVILLSAEEGFRWSRVDAGIAVENISLAAESMGLGSLIIGCIYDALRGEKRDYFAKALKLPENYNFVIAIAAGHKAVEKVPHTFDAGRQITYL